MSWKGFQKSVARAPQQIRRKVHKGEYDTDDALFDDVLRRFESIEHHTKKLHEESRRYKETVNGIFQHQIEYIQAIEHLSGPISGSFSDPETLMPQGNLDGIAACQQYRELIIQLRQQIDPELELIGSRILRPAVEMLSIMNSTRKMLTKREHKQIDVERREASLRKFQEKQDRSAKDAEKMHKAENDLEIAQEEYNHVAGMLKDELPKLFALEGQFFKPLFESFYFIQLNIYYTMSSRMEEMKIPYFNLDSDILGGFHSKRGTIEQQVGQLGILHSHLDHADDVHYGQLSGESPSDEYSYDEPPPYNESRMSPRASRRHDRYSYLSDSDHSDVSSPRGSNDFAPEKPPRMPPRPRPAPKTAEVCTALYDFNAQTPSDLSFQEGDTIEIVRRTDSTEDWWLGRLNGVEGNFPANYVKL